MRKIIVSLLLMFAVGFTVPTFSAEELKPKEIVLASSDVKVRYNAKQEKKQEKMTPKKKKDTWFGGALTVIIIIGFIIL